MASAMPLLDANGSEVAGWAVEPGLQLFGAHVAQLARAGDGEELGLVDGVVAAQEDRRRASMSPSLPQRHVGERLDVVLGQHVEEGDDVGDGRFAGGVDALGFAIAGGSEVFDGREAGSGLLDVGGVAALGAGGDEVLAGVGVDHELLRAGAAHACRSRPRPR